MSAEMIAGPATQLVVDCTNFDAIFQAANRAAWIAVADDPVLNAGLSAASVQFVNISKAVLSNCDALCSCEHIVDALRNIFVGKTFCSETDRDSVTNSVHWLHGSVNIEMDFRCCVRNLLPNTDEIISRQLLHIWLRKLIIEIFRILSDLCVCDDAASAPELLTDTEQEVLYHVCGYIVSKLSSLLCIGN